MNLSRFVVPGSKIACTFALLLAVAQAADPLVVPVGFSAPVLTTKHEVFECPEVPTPFRQALDFPSKYEGSGKARDELNADADDRYKQAIAPITTFEIGVATVSSGYMRQGDSEELNCVLTWLDQWATSEALLGKSTTHTGKSVRKWSLASISSSYLRLQRSRSNPLKGHEEQQAHIERWLKAIASQVIVEWPLDTPLKKVNNHFYWAAWSLVATGVAINDRSMFNHGMAIYRLFERQVTQDGLLPNELARKSRALEYHAYALSPLAMIATFAIANGEAIEVGPQSPLGKLANTVFDGLTSPPRFADLVASKQETSKSVASNYGWLEPYCSLGSCSDVMTNFLHSNRPMKSTRMGGDLTSLFAGSNKP